MDVKIKNPLKRLDTSKIMINLRNTFYVEKEMQDIMKKFYVVQRNLIILSIFSKNIIDTELKFSG